MKRSTRLRAKVLVIIFALVMGPLALPQPGVEAQAAPSVGGKATVHLPLVDAPARPDFTIISPTPGASISGTSFFAIQPAEPGSITSVSFQAGATVLGTDSTAGDGFQSFLDAATLPAGPLQLSATASGPGGTTTKSITVTIVPKPPASATVGATGTTLATTSGNTIVVPPGAVSPGTTVSVQDKTQAQVTHDEGIDWDAIGVTFLGAIHVQANGPITKPLGVSSVGFGNRIQQGQAVVTYRILPDADGDGVGELVAVDGANLAPNNTIVSSPIPQIIVNDAATGAAADQASADQASADQASVAEAGLHGPPGTTISVDGSGFNAISLNGNVAIWTSQVNGKQFEIPGVIQVDSSNPSLQRFSTVIPPLAAGGATVVLTNQSTGSSTAPIPVTIDASKPLDRPATDVFDLFLKDSIDYLNSVPTHSAEQAASLTTLKNNLTQSRTDLHTLVTHGLSADENAALTQVALMIANSTFYKVGAADLDTYTADAKFSDALSVLWGVASVLGAIAIVTTASPFFLGFAAGFGIGIGLAVVGYYACRIIGGGSCFDDPPAPAAACSAAATAAGAGDTGMGGAPPAGGSGCGNAGGAVPAGRSASLNASGGRYEAGRFIVKILPPSGTNLLTPFTGASDPSGYFYIPIIPQNEPFRAVATDQDSGAQVSAQGVGPAEGRSILLNFDFSKAKSNLYPIAVGDTVSNGVSAPGAGNIETAGGEDVYTFHATAGQGVFFDILGDTIGVSWQLHSPSGVKIFDDCLGCGTPGAFTMPETGTYKITVGGENSNVTGKYSFKLWNVPAPQHFAIAVGDTISNGVPAAGNIESPGALDIYTFHANAGQGLYFDILGSGVSIDWKLQAPNGDKLFDDCTGCGDPGVYTLAQAGTYTLTVGDARNNAVGPYSFKIWNRPAPQHFATAVGNTVSNGVPAAGAGHIETPGVEDIYTFHANANQRVYFDILGNGVSIDWKLQAPNGDKVFDDCTGCGDPGAFTLVQAGTYTITVGQANNDAVGTYSFKLWNVPASQHFAIAIGDTVSNGAPAAGAGNIETPGVLDIYTFHANAGQKVDFTVLLSGVSIDWKLQAPNGDKVFDDCTGCGDPGVFTLAQAGTYTITVGQANNDAVGTYSFKLTAQ